MKKLILGCLIYLTGLNLYAQGTITGRIDNQDKELVSFASIAIYQNDSIITSTISNDEGRRAKQS